MRKNLLLVLIFSSSGVVSANSIGIIEHNIDSFARNGDLVSLTDGMCRYAGKLVRKNSLPSIASTTLQAVNADSGQWEIEIANKACDGLYTKVSLHIALPRPPSLVGGGGIPPDFIGYKAGSRFTLLPN